MGPTPEISATIYEKNADRLGMLGLLTVERVAELYSRLISREPASRDGKIDIRTFIRTVDSWIESMTRHIELAQLVDLELGIVAATGDWTAVALAHQAGSDKAKAASKKQSAASSGTAPPPPAA